MMKRTITFLCTMGFVFVIVLVRAQGIPARQESKLEQVYAQYNLTGEGTIIAIIDRGIDYYHPDFIDENGNTRLLFLYDMINQEGANDPDNPYGVGTIFDEAEIQSSLDTDGLPLSMDHYGHGTATTGITGGNGSAISSSDFQGVAPGAKFIIVKAIQDYFPPYDDQAGQDGFYNPTYIPIAFEFLTDKLAEQGNPSVTLLNMGSIGGPTDGTSTISRAMSDFVEGGNTLVCGVGDDGGNINHASATLEENEFIEMRIQKAETGNLRLDLWYDESDRFDVTIGRPNLTIEGPFDAPATANDADDRFLTGINYYHRGANVDFAGATSDRRELMIDFTGVTGEYVIRLTASTINGSGKFHATLNPSRQGNDNKFLTHAVPGYSLNDFTSTANVISPGDYVVKNDWVDNDGIPRSISGQGDPGELWKGSSWGPTQDGRHGIDFVACGEVLYTAYSANTWYSHFPHLLLQGGEGNYGIQNAVSAAAPLTTGVIALMLEVKPELTPAEIKSILQSTSRQDSFTGTVPNNQWGYGKLDALAAIQKVETLGFFENQQKSQVFNIVPNPATQQIQIVFEEKLKSDVRSITILNNLGQRVLQISTFDHDQRIDIAQLPEGIYHITIEHELGVSTSRFVKK